MPFEFDGEWLVQNEYVRSAFESGYMAVKWQGKYLLVNVHEPDVEYEYDTLEELNRMAKLIVED